MGFLDHAGLTYLWGKVKAALGLKMDASVYDPTGKREDVYGYADAKAAAAENAAKAASRPVGWIPTAADVGAVPSARKINGKALTADITLSAGDVGARPSTWMPTATEVGADPGGTAQGLVNALPVKKLVGTAEHPIDLDTLTEAGRYYIEGELVEKADPLWDSLIGVIKSGVPVDVTSMQGWGQTFLQSISIGFELCQREKNDESPWSAFEVATFAMESESITATLRASAWTGSAAPYTQTVSVMGLAARSNGTIGLSQSATAAQRAAAREAMLCVTGQASGALTVTADGEKLTVDIPVTVTILG